MRVLLLPDAERGFADPEVPADIGRCRAAFALAERVGDLGFAELRTRLGSLLLGRRTVEAASEL